MTKPAPTRKQERCAYCQEHFTPKKPKQRFCTQPCAYKAARVNFKAHAFRQWNGVNEPVRGGEA